MELQTANYKIFRVGTLEFTDYRQANHCLPGDSVEWQETKCRLIKRAKHRFIPGILETTSKTIYGHSSRGSKLFLFHPHDRKYPPFRVGSNCRDTVRNQLGLIEFMDWEDFETLPRGNLIRLVGPCGEIEAEKKALTYQYSFPQLASQLFDIEEPNEADRILLDGFTFNIDPDGCMDIDDVLTLKQISDTKWQFVITISDVAAHIPANSPGDVHAFQLGQTLYQNGEAIVPMLPAALSEMALSLRPNEKHVGVSLFCEWNTETKQLTVGDFKETIFQNNRSYSYDSVYRADEFPLQILQEIASSLHGSITTDSHEWVAECMILYNKEVAKKLLETCSGLLRTHKPADADKLKAFTTIHPGLQALAYEAAKYEPTGPGLIHAGLGEVPYAHASSPIRRYADLVNQRALKAILKGQASEAVSQDLVTHLNATQKKMRAYERSLFFLEQIGSQTSGTVEGYVVFVEEDKTKVFIPSWKLMIRVEPGQYTIGQTLTIEYYANLQKPHWDERMVFCVKNKANEDEVCDEQCSVESLARANIDE
jgi:exoribonuclease R